MFLKLALRNIFRNRSRSLITLLAIASGCMALIIAGGFIEDAVTMMREAYIHDFLGHLRIYQPGFLENGTLHPFDYMISDPGKLLQQIGALEHVRYAAPRLGFAGLLSNGESTISLFAEGVDPEIENQPRSTVNMQAGDYFQKDGDYQIILGKGLAKALGSKVGDSVVLMTNTQRGAINASDMTVQGIFSTADKAFDDHSARLPLATAKKLLRVKEVQTLIVFLDRTVNTNSVKKALEDLFRKQGLSYEVKAWYELEDADFVLKAVAFYQRIFWVLKCIIILIVTLSIINTMNMAVLERIGEVGTLMALGTRQGGVVLLFILEGLFLGILGGAVGCAGGVLAALVISRIGIPMPSPPGSTVHWVAHIAVVPSVLIFAIGMALATALISSIVPAIKASRLEIGEALRHNL